MQANPFTQFKRLLAGSGYFQYYLAFGNGNLRQEEWADHAKHLPPALEPLARLFLLGQALDAQAVAGLIGEEIFQALADAGILRSEDGKCRSEYLLACFNSIPFFCNFNAHLKPPAVYFGPDSVALGTFHIPHKDGVGLDLCAGSGVQAMNMARHGLAQITAVEINPVAARVAELNLRLNGLQEQIRLFNLSVEDFAAQDPERYDCVLFNPPFVPVPNTMNFPLVGGGGEDGLRIVKQILAAYLPRLNPGGSMEFLGFGLGRDGDPFFVEEFRKIMRDNPPCRGTVLLTGRIKLAPGNQGYDMMIFRSALNTQLHLDYTYQAFAQHFANLGANELYFYSARLENAAPQGDMLNVLNLAREIYQMDITRDQTWMR